MAGRGSRRNKNLLAKGTTCALAAGLTALLVAGCARTASAATAAGPDVDLVRLQASYDNGPKRVKDAVLESYLRRVTKRLTKANSELDTLGVTVHVLREPLPYVFVLDNGTVYVSTGLIARLGNETQLVGLIAAHLAALVRRDDQTLNRSMRERALAEFVPDLLFVTATLGLGAQPLNDAQTQRREALRRKLQAQADAVALSWLSRAGYDPREVPRGVQQLLDELTREQQFGQQELNNEESLRLRVISFTAGLPPDAPSSPTPGVVHAPVGMGSVAPESASASTGVGPAAPESVSASTAIVPATRVATFVQDVTSDPWPLLSRHYAFEIATDDLNNGRSVALLALVDSIEATAGPSGQTTWLRAQNLQKTKPGQEHLPEVIAAYERCTAYPDAPPAAFRELAFAYRKTGATDQARANFQKYLSRAPKAADAPIIQGYIEEH